MPMGGNLSVVLSHMDVSLCTAQAPKIFKSVQRILGWGFTENKTIYLSTLVPGGDGYKDK